MSTIKKDIQQALIKRVNKQSLKNKFGAAPSIWRMKQLGEKDESHFDIKSGGEKINGINYIVPNEDNDKADN